MSGSSKSHAQRRLSQDLLFWLAAGAVILLVTLLLAAAFLANNSQRADEARARAAIVETWQRRFEIERVALIMRDAESSQRGYVLTGDAAFLRRNRQASRVIEAQIDRLAAFYARDPDQALRVGELRDLSRAKFDEMDRILAIRDARGLAPAAAAVAEGRGEALMEDARRILDAMAQAEVRTLDARLAAERAEAARSRLFSNLAFALVIFAILTAALMAFRYTVLRTRLIRRVRDEADRREAIFHSALDAIITFNPSGGVETLNRAAERMFGYRQHELVGRDISVLAPEAAHGDALFVERLRESAAGVREVEARRKDGSSLPVDIHIGEMVLPDGVHAVAVLRDATERRRADVAKAEFISTVSHELRTPLTAIAGSLGLLASGAAGALPERAGRLIALAENNCRRLVRLINDILDIEKIGSGGLDLDRAPLDLTELARRTLETMDGVAEAFGVRFHLEAPAHPVTVEGDADRLIQVITNLLSNAAKFSPAGSTVRLTIEAQGRSAFLSVADQGEGVPEGFRDRIFQRFAQADSSDTRRKGGTGLGLAICKEIVERHGGRISFLSPPGAGATFVVELPLASAPPSAPTAGPADGGFPLLLHVDDDPDLRQLIEAACLGRFRLIGAHSLGDARERLASLRPDLVILDVGLPDGSGLTLLPLLRGDGGRIPVVVFSAQALPEQAGVDAVLVKSRTSLEDLLAAVGRLTRRKTPPEPAET